MRNRHLTNTGLMTVLLAMLATACTEMESPSTFEPVMSIDEATDVTRTEATLHASITLRGKTEMPEATFRYGKTPDMEQSIATQEGTKQGELLASLDGLTPGATYYWCLTASNGTVCLSTDTLQFTTEPNSLPSVGDMQMLSSGPTSLIVSMSIPDNGGESLTETGCYVRKQSQEGSRKMVATNTTEEGEMRLRIGQLEQNCTYEIWGFAANTAGEAVSDTVTYTTGSTFTIQKAGELAELMSTDRCTIKSLSIKGPLNGDDINCLRRMAGRDSEGNDTGGLLADIDLTEAIITEGGGPYDQGHYTKDNVVGIGMFANLDRLERILLPTATKQIEENAFEYCQALAVIKIPALTAEIGQSRGCTALDSITVDAANTHYSSNDGVLFNADTTQIVWFPMGKSGDYTLPQSVTSIGDYAFRQCSITRFTLPAGLKEIGRGVFSQSMVEEVTLPENLQQLPTGTFQGCKQLKQVTIGSQVELVSDYVFDGCPLAALYVKAVYPPVCNSNTMTTSGTDFTTTCILYVPKGCKARYRSSDGWNKITRIRETDFNQ